MYHQYIHARADTLVGLGPNGLRLAVHLHVYNIISAHQTHPIRFWSSRSHHFLFFFLQSV